MNLDQLNERHLRLPKDLAESQAAEVPYIGRIARVSRELAFTEHAIRALKASPREDLSRNRAA